MNSKFILGLFTYSAQMLYYTVLFGRTLLELMSWLGSQKKLTLAKNSKIIHSNVSVLLGYIKSIWFLNIYFMFLLLGLFLAAMVLGLRGIYFLTMKASHVDGPVWNISAVCLYFAITNKIMGIYYGPSRFLCLPREKKNSSVASKKSYLKINNYQNQIQYILH